MDFDKIMHEITAGLTGDVDKDAKYLMDKSLEYKDSEYGKEIARACGRLLFDILPDDKKKIIDQESKNHFFGTNVILEEVKFNIYKHDFIKARHLLEMTIDKIEKVGLYQDDAVSEYHTFDNAMEFIIYSHLHKPKKTVRPVPESFSDIYFTYGSLLFELGEYDKSKTALEKAIHWNPVSPNIFFEYSELFKKDGDMESYWDLTCKIFQIAYTSSQIARCYRNLGYCFVEKNMWQEAASCYILSMNFDDENTMAQSELFYIQSKSPEEITAPTHEQLREYAQFYNFPLGANSDVIGLAVAFGRECMENQQYDEARFYFSIAYDLTGDDGIKSILEIISDK